MDFHGNLLGKYTSVPWYGMGGDVVNVVFYHSN